MPLSIDFKSDNNITIIKLAGDLDTYTAPEFLEKFNDYILTGSKLFIIDLSDVNFVSSAGWGALSSSLKKSRENFGDLVLYGMKGQVKRVYKIMGFRAVLKAFDDLDEAVKYLLGKRK